LRQITEIYRIFHPSRLLFTKLDETLSFGPLLEEAVRTKWPVSFLGIGASIPEDLIPATPDVLADLIVGRRPVNRRLPEEGPSRNGPVAGG
jgi:flagellar biosynthesis protein FlhF